jgi:hypothetical protein
MVLRKVEQNGFDLLIERVLVLGLVLGKGRLPDHDAAEVLVAVVGLDQGLDL